MKVYFDNCCLNRPYDDQSQAKVLFETAAKLYVQQQIIDGAYDLAWSYVLDYEVGRSPFAERRDRILHWKGIAKVDCAECESILQEAEALQHIGLKVADSLHVACADFLHCNYMLTTDGEMLKKPIHQVTSMPVVNPIEFIQREVIC